MLPCVFIFLFRIVLLHCLCLDYWILNMNNSLLLIIIILGFNRICSIVAGWRTFSKLSLLGSLRTVSQLISYEILLYICLFFWLYLVFFFDFGFLGHQTGCLIAFSLPRVFLIWLLSVLAELNRTPYDFSEGERELVRGYNVEYGSSGFTFIFLAEYGNIFFFICLTSYVIFSGRIFFSFFMFIFVLWVRSVLPRFRFDKLIGLTWKVLFPQLAFLLVLFYAACS